MWVFLFFQCLSVVTCNNPSTELATGIPAALECSGFSMGNDGAGMIKIFK